MFCFLYFSGINDTPRYDDKTVLDIRNQTNQNISGMYLSVIVPETFEMLNNSDFNKKINIPDIKPYDRIIVVLDQKSVSLPGMKLELVYNDYSDIIVDELHKNVGSMHIINLEEDLVSSRNINNHLFQKYFKFYWKRYSNVIELPGDTGTR